ncbi:RNA 2',3'-cyclic phosphodiesterase [Stackebrandtia endophytica]
MIQWKGTYRLFAAIRPPRDAIDHLTDYLTDLHVAVPWSRCLRYDLWHVTVAYLGETETDRVGRIGEAMRSAVEHTSLLRLALSGGGRWGRGRYNIVYTGLSGEVDRLVGLAMRTRVAFDEVGQDYDRKQYRPHLTLAPASARLGNAESAEDLFTLRRYQGPEWTVSSVGLYNSVVHPELRYDLIDSVELG